MIDLIDFLQTSPLAPNTEINNACMMHLWHKKRFAKEEGIINNKILKVNFDNNTFVCKNGIEKQATSSIKD